MRVEQVHLGGGDGGADGNGGGHLLHGGHPEAGGEEGALGGAVAGGDGNAQLVDDAAHVGGAHDVATGEQLLHGLEAVQVGLHHLREEAGGKVEGGDGVVREDGGERVQITRRSRGEDDEASAVEQRAPDFEGGGVEGDGGDEEEGLAGGDIGVGRIADGAQHVAVGDGDALGPAGGAGGEVDIGQVLGQQRHGGGVYRLRGGIHLIHEENGQRVGGRKRSAQRGVGEKEGGLSVLDHLRQALGRVGGVEGKVGAAGLEDGEQGDDELDGSLESESDGSIRANAACDEQVGELVGPRVQLPVGEALLGELQGDGVGVLGDDAGEDVNEGGVAGEGRGGAVEVDEDGAALILGKQGQPVEGLLGPCEQRLQEADVQARQPLGGGRQEQVGVVDERADEAVRGLGEVELQIELRDRVVQREGAEGHSFAGELRDGSVLEGEEDLEQRRPVE